MTARLAWLEITADYRCNNRCVGCFSARDDGPSMRAAEIAHALETARAQGATALWLGGGEPTLRRDLFAIVERARAIGFERIKLQTNGMMLAYPAFASRCREAGIDQVSFSIKGSHAALHDRLTQTPGCHAAMCAGIENARREGFSLEADLLLYRSNVADVEAMVRAYLATGITRFRAWVLSSADATSDEVRREVPRLTDVTAALARAALVLPEPTMLESLHTPPCVVPQRAGFTTFDAASLHMRVVNPGGEAFMLEDSAIEGGTYLATCETCSVRATCRGLRADYLAIHGPAEFRPLPHA